jgi:hypothetical protein
VSVYVLVISTVGGKRGVVGVEKWLLFIIQGGDQRASLKEVRVYAM